jgi:hypothetical protein
VRLSIGVTGHRTGNAAFAANQAAIEAQLFAIFDRIDAVLAAEPPLMDERPPAPTRLHSMLVDGLDQIASANALDRGWELVAPLPFGRALNLAINAQPETVEEARALLAGAGACGSATQLRADRIRALEARARLFELGDADAAVAELYLASLAAPGDIASAQAYAFKASERVALAAQVMIEQSDLIIGVWDAASTAFIGGTGHTIALALELGAPVIWIDARAPQRWRILRAPESLAAIAAGADPSPDRDAAIDHLVQLAVRPPVGKTPHPHGGAMDGVKSMQRETWRPRSSSAWHAYRRVEALFGGRSLSARLAGLTQTYESPDAISDGSGASQLAVARDLPGQEPGFAWPTKCCAVSPGPTASPHACPTPIAAA